MEFFEPDLFGGDIAEVERHFEVVVQQPHRKELVHYAVKDNQETKVAGDMVVLAGD